jgi:hypothetical protein
VADFTLTNVDRYPPGTSVDAYRAEGSGVPEGGPVGTAEDTQTMGVSSLTFTDLESGVRYFAYALVGGQHRYTGFIVGEDSSSEIGTELTTELILNRADGPALSIRPSEANVEFYGGTPDPIGIRADIRLGSAADPYTAAEGGAFKVSRTDATTREGLTAATGSATTDGGEYMAAILGETKVLAAGEVQGVGVGGYAQSAATGYGAGVTSGNDACGIYGGGRITGAGTGVGIGAFFVGRRDNDTGKITGVETHVANYGTVAGSYNSTGYSLGVAHWVNAGGNADSGVAFQIGNAFGRQFKVGIGANAQVTGGLTGGVADSFIRDDSHAATSIDIRGTHATAALQIASTAGNVGIGIAASSGAKAFVKASADAQYGLAVRANSATHSVYVLTCQDSAGAALFGVGATGALTLADGAHINTGTTNGTRIGTATTQKLGFWNATPVVQPTAVADATDAGTAISQLNALLARMRTIGMIAT